MPPQTHMVVFGVLELEGKKVLLPLRNKSILTESLKRDSFFEPTGRYSYLAWILTLLISLNLINRSFDFTKTYFKKNFINYYN